MNDEPLKLPNGIFYYPSSNQQSKGMCPFKETRTFIFKHQSLVHNRNFPVICSVLRCQKLYELSDGKLEKQLIYTCEETVRCSRVLCIII